MLLVSVHPRRLGRLALGLALLLTMPLVSLAQEASSTATKLAQYMEAQAARRGFSGAVLVEKDGQPLLRQGYGLANIELDLPNTPETRFRLGSITKSFTAMAVMVLREQGKLSVDDPVSKYLTDAPEAWKDLTIRHLLTHTSGIPSFTSFLDYNATKRQQRTPRQLIDRFRDMPLTFEPGTQYAYSNSGYVVLGALIEKVSGQSYENFLKEQVLDPLGLADTGYDHAERIIPRRASGYGKGPDGKPVNADFLDMSIPFSAGALYSTVDDMSRWAAAFDQKKLVSEAAHDEITTPFKNNYGYGWSISERDGKKLINHGGGIDGFLTMIDRYPEEKLLVVVLSNSETSNPGVLAGDLAQIASGKEVELPRDRVEITLKPEVLDRYVGTYDLAPGLELTITRVGDKLMGQLKGQPPAELFAESETVFFPKVVDATLEFERDDKGQITGLILRQEGRETKGKRVPPR